MSDETLYTPVGEELIAYQVTGEGPLDIVYMSGGITQIDIALEEPTFSYFAHRLAGMGRLIRFDRRGSGASDPLPEQLLPSWETWIEDIRAALDAVGSERAVLIAAHEAGPTAILFAATYPDRVAGLVLSNTTARFLVDDGYEAGVPLAAAEAILESLRATWGTEQTTRMVLPSQANNPRLRRWYAKLQRASMSPRVAALTFRKSLDMDVRTLLGSIEAPTLVIHNSNLALVPVAQGRYLAENIPRATLVELPGADLVLYTEFADEALAHLETFLASIGTWGGSERSLATVLFTDIVASTERAARDGDARWKQMLNTYDDIVRRSVEASRGKIVKSTGDGTLATFDGPGRAIACAFSLIDSLGDVGLEIRVGLHCGEIERRGDDVGGIAVHIAARVMDTAMPGIPLVSRTVRDLVAGSGLTFEDYGLHTLKGLDEKWQLFSVLRPNA